MWASHSNGFKKFGQASEIVSGLKDTGEGDGVAKMDLLEWDGGVLDRICKFWAL